MFSSKHDAKFFDLTESMACGGIVPFAVDFGKRHHAYYELRCGSGNPVIRLDA